MSGQIINGIVNCFTTGQTNQIFISGANVTNHFAPLSAPETKFKSEECGIQTIDPEKPPSDGREQMMMVLKESEYMLASFHRTKFTFIKAIADQITSPLHCIGGFIDNALEAYEIAKAKHEAMKSQP